MPFKTHLGYSLKRKCKWVFFESFIQNSSSSYSVADINLNALREIALKGENALEIMG